MSDGRRLDQLKPNLLGSPLKDCPSTSVLWCLSANFLTTQSDFVCVKVQTVHSMMSRNVPKAAHSMFRQNWVECSFVTCGSSCTPNGVHQECICETDLPANWWYPEGLIIGSKQTLILVCIGFKMKLIKYIILYPTHCIAVSMKSLDHCCMYLWTQPIPHGAWESSCTSLITRPSRPSICHLQY